MLDVHAPHERIHGFRDFLLHLLTITIGLLIALGLEGLVEMRHHHQLREEADSNMRREIEDNRKELAAVHAAVVKQREDLKNVLAYVQARSNNQSRKTNELNVNFRFGTFKSASWSTASATGALSFMDYSHVQKYADAYELQTEFMALQRETLQGILKTQAYFEYGFDPDKFPASDAEAAKSDVRLDLSQLTAIDQVGQTLDSVYAEALK